MGTPQPLLKLVLRPVIVDPRPLIEKLLQDQRCRYLVDELAVRLPSVAGLVENLVGLMAGEALIPEMDGQAGELAELLGKGLTLQSLRADLSGKLEWVADDDTRDAEAPTQPGKRTQVFAAVRASVKGEHRLCGKT